jgi:hypothetical protein
MRFVRRHTLVLRMKRDQDFAPPRIADSSTRRVEHVDFVTSADTNVHANIVKYPIIVVVELPQWKYHHTMAMDFAFARYVSHVIDVAFACLANDFRNKQLPA